MAPGVATASPRRSHLVHGLDEEVVEEVPLLVCDSLGEEGKKNHSLRGPPKARAVTPLPSYQGKEGVTVPCGNPRPSWDTVGKSLPALGGDKGRERIGLDGAPGLCPAPEQNSREMQEIRHRGWSLDTLWELLPWASPARTRSAQTSPFLGKGGDVPALTWKRKDKLAPCPGPGGTSLSGCGKRVFYSLSLPVRGPSSSWHVQPRSKLG